MNYSLQTSETALLGVLSWRWLVNAVKCTETLALFLTSRSHQTSPFAASLNEKKARAASSRAWPFAKSLNRAARWTWEIF